MDCANAYVARYQEPDLYSELLPSFSTRQGLRVTASRVVWP